MTYTLTIVVPERDSVVETGDAPIAYNAPAAIKLILMAALARTPQWTRLTLEFVNE